MIDTYTLTFIDANPSNQYTVDPVPIGYDPTSVAFTSDGRAYVPSGQDLWVVSLAP